MDIDALFKVVGLLVRNRYAIDVPEVVNPEKNPNMSDGVIGSGGDLEF